MTYPQGPSDIVVQVQEDLRAKGWKIECLNCDNCAKGQFLATKGRRQWLVQVIEQVVVSED